MLADHFDVYSIKIFRLLNNRRQGVEPLTGLYHPLKQKFGMPRFKCKENDQKVFSLLHERRNKPPIIDKEHAPGITTG